MNLAYKIYVKIDTHTQKKQPKKKNRAKVDLPGWCNDSFVWLSDLWYLFAVLIHTICLEDCQALQQFLKVSLV